MKKIFAKFIHFWNEDRSLNMSLWLLVLIIFVFSPLLHPAGYGGIIIRITYSVILLTGILSVTRSKIILVALAILAAIAMVTNWLDYVPTRSTMIAHDFGMILFNLFFAISMLIKTFKPGEINFQRIEGSIVVYLLMGLIFAFVFHAIYLFAGTTSFNNIGDNDVKQFLYFSFTTLTTAGYGDITPVVPVARSIANFEAVIGQLYPAILIGRLVSMEFDSSKRKREKS